LPGPCRDMKDTVSSSQSRHFSLSLNHHVRGERERSSPLPEIVQSRFLHLTNSQGSARPEFNGGASPWANTHKISLKNKKKNFQAGCQCTSKPLPGPCRDMKDTVSSSQSRHFSLSLNHHVRGERERSSPL